VDNGAAGFSSPSDGRAGATAVLDATAEACTAVNTSEAGAGALYDCAGKAAALDALA
jgi:hypothetical protein